MTSIKCPECKKEVSIFTEICPHCGFRLKKQQSCLPRYNDKASRIIIGEYRKKWIGGLIGGILLVLSGMIFLCASSSPSIIYNADAYASCLGYGIGFLLGGIILIPVSIHKLNQY